MYNSTGLGLVQYCMWYKANYVMNKTHLLNKCTVLNNIKKYTGI